MTDAPPDWAVAIPATAGVHQYPANNQLIRPELGLNLKDLVAQAVEEFLRNVVLALKGVFTNGIAAFDQLVDWAAELPLIGPLVEAITGIVGGTLEDLQDFFTTLLDGLWAAFTGQGDTGKPIVDIIGVITDSVGDLFDRVIGIRPGLHGIGQMTATPINLVQNPGFDTAVSLSGEGVWTWDDTQDHTGVSGSGSAKTTANSGVREILSNAVAVTEGQELTGAGWVRWSGVSAAGGTYPMQIGLVTYLNGTAVGTPYFERVPAGTATSGWIELSGSYTVPSGVDTVRMSLKVNADATAGTVWFDDLHLSKTGLLSQGFVENLLDDLGDLVPIPIFNDLLDTLAGTVGATLDDIIDWIANLLTGDSDLDGSKITIGSIIDSVIPGLGTVMDNIWAKLTGNEPEGSVSHTEVADALASTANTLTGNTAAITALQAVFTGGVSTGDDFEREASSMGSNWSVTYSSGPGNLAVNGHELYWDNDAFNMDERTAVCRWLGTNPASQTDYQVATIVLASQAEKPAIGTSGINSILLRMNDAKTSYVKASWKGDDTVSVWRCVNGVETQMNSGSCPAPGAGASLTFQAGKPGTARYYKLSVNGATKLEWTEASADSMVGASYRGWGLGCRAGTATLAITQSRPGRVKVWVAQDL